MTHHTKPHLAAEHKKRQHRTHSSTGSHQHEARRERLLRQVLIGQRRKLLQSDSPENNHLHLSIEHAGEARAGGKGLILEVFRREGLQCLQLTGTLVGSELALRMNKRIRTDILKEVESRETLNFIQIRQNRVFRSVHLSDVHFSFQCISQVLPNRSELHAVSAPLSNQPTLQQSYRSVELDKPTAGRGPTVHLSEQFEVVIVQINHLWKSVHYRFPTRTRQAKNKGDSKYTIR